MSMFSDAQRGQVAERLAGLVHPITLALYVQTLDCDTCDETRRLLEDLATISPLIRLDEKNLVLDREAAAAHHVELAPSIVVLGDEDGAAVDYGVRFAGAPVGYEFSSLLDAMLTVSRREPDLAEPTLARLATLAAAVHFQVFSTPT
jgi:alkyl hydroperoxide reductase subunit AhpF